MNLKTAQENFLKLVDSIEINSMQPFLDWIKDSFSTRSSDREPESNENDLIMSQIVDDLKQLMPSNGLLPTEKQIWPQEGFDPDCNPNTTVHVDSFLFDDNDVDEMCENATNGFSRNYCLACGSHSTAPLTFISHSASVKQLKFIFNDVLPSLHGKTVLDVGSRLGGVLYAAYVYSNAPNIVGVEMNHDFCNLQKQIVDKYVMNDRIKIICDDIRNRIDDVQKANVVILHNVFQFFLPSEEQETCWNFLYENIRPSTILVCMPSLNTVTNYLRLKFSIDDWTTSIDVDHLIKKIAVYDEDAVDELSKIFIYEIKKIEHT